MLRTGDTHHLSVDQFADLVFAAAPGALIVYARGDIAHDKNFARTSTAPNPKELLELATIALSLQENRRVTLTQRRMGPNCFEYRATKRRPPQVIPRQRQLLPA